MVYLGLSRQVNGEIHTEAVEGLLDISRLKWEVSHPIFMSTYSDNSPWYPLQSQSQPMESVHNSTLII